MAGICSRKWYHEGGNLMWQMFVTSTPVESQQKLCLTANFYHQTVFRCREMRKKTVAICAPLTSLAYGDKSNCRGNKAMFTRGKTSGAVNIRSQSEQHHPKTITVLLVTQFRNLLGVRATLLKVS